MDIHHAFTTLGLPPQATLAQARAAYQLLRRQQPELRAPTAQLNAAYTAIVAHLLVRPLWDRASGAQATPPPIVGAANGHAPGFVPFDCKRGFVADGPVLPARRILRLSLAEAARGGVKRMAASTAGRYLRQVVGDPGNALWVADIRIPPGTRDGAEVALEHMQIQASAHAQVRGLRVTVELEKHPLFQLQDDRLTVTVPLSVWDWMLGGVLTVPTLDGVVRMAFAPYAVQLMLRDHGWPCAGLPQQRHPLYVQLHRFYPESLIEANRNLLHLLAARARVPEVQAWQRSMQAWVESPRDANSTQPGT